MQPPGRDGRGNNSRPMNGGFPFMDPFAGFGARPTFLNDMFENDPFFSDPFFSRPFNSIFGSAGGPPSIFGSHGFFNQGLFGNQEQGGNLLDRRPYRVKRGKKVKNDDPADAVLEGNRRNVHIEDGNRRGVHIEELPDDHDIVGDGQTRSNQEPIIEHPDDDETETFPHQAHGSRQQSRRSHSDIIRHQPRSTSTPSRSANNPVRSYSYQSSSVMYGGANGPYYAAQTKRSVGPEGVIEEEHEEKDGTSGKHIHRLSHGLYDKGRSFTRKRNAEGQEEKFETLHNLAEDEAQDFEKTWETAAEKNLPKWNKSSAHRIGSSSKARPALPPGGSSHSSGQ